MQLNILEAGRNRIRNNAQNGLNAVLQFHAVAVILKLLFKQFGLGHKGNRRSVIIADDILYAATEHVQKNGRKDKKLSSAIGFKGIAKKVLILMLVGVANILDVNVVGGGAILRGAVILLPSPPGI